MEETKWVVEINEELNSNGCTASEKEQWAKHSIYKVHPRDIELNKEAFKPKGVSFGPYHYGDEQLKVIEEHKHRALIHFLKRCKKPVELVFQRMGKVVQELRDSYNPLDPIWKQDTPKFLQMMILDGCFMLEIIKSSEYALDDYADNDPIFGRHGRLYVVPYIKRDMLMLENQLPMKVLHILIQVETDMVQMTQEEEEKLNKRILKFFQAHINGDAGGFGKCKHILDLYRKMLIQKGPSHPTRPPKRSHTLINKLFSETRGFERSARELHEAGIRFKKSETPSLRDVSFRRGVLRLPRVLIDDNSEYVFLNLIAFERFYVESRNEVTSYVAFMDEIIDNEMDVELLQKRGVLINGLGSNKAVAKLFNSMAKDITVSNGEEDHELTIYRVRKNINKYCKKPWKKWRANLIQTYFRNPWALISLLAAIFLSAIAILQTVYTISQYYNDKKHK